MKWLWLVLAWVVLGGVIRLAVWLGEVLWEDRYKRWTVGEAAGLGFGVGSMLGVLGWLALALVRLGSGTGV
jgi:hypothetical protein